MSDTLGNDIPRLDQCYLCKAWRREKDLFAIEIRDAVGWIRKLACGKCLDEIVKKEENRV